MFTIFENHVYQVKKILMFAKNLVTYCSIFVSFSYATQVKVCKKFGDLLLHFLKSFFLCYTGKSLQKIGDFTPLFNLRLATKTLI